MVRVERECTRHEKRSCEIENITSGSNSVDWNIPSDSLRSSFFVQCGRSSNTSCLINWVRRQKPSGWRSSLVVSATLKIKMENRIVYPPVSPLPSPDFQASVQKSGSGRGPCWRIYRISIIASLQNSAGDVSNVLRDFSPSWSFPRSQQRGA